MRMASRLADHPHLLPLPAAPSRGPLHQFAPFVLRTLSWAAPADPRCCPAHPSAPTPLDACCLFPPPAGMSQVTEKQIAAVEKQYKVGGGSSTAGQQYKRVQGAVRRSGRAVWCGWQSDKAALRCARPGGRMDVAVGQASRAGALSCVHMHGCLGTRQGYLRGQGTAATCGSCSGKGAWVNQTLPRPSSSPPTSPTHPLTHPQKHPQHTPPPPLHTTHHLPVCHCTTYTTPWSHKVPLLPHPPTHPPAQTHADLREHDPVYDGEGARAAGAAGQVALAQVGCVHSYAFFYVFVVCL